MIRRLSPLLECAAALGFAGTTLAVAHVDRPAPLLPETDVMLLGASRLADDPGGDTLRSLIAQPTNVFLWSLLIVVVMMALLHVVLRAESRFRPSQDAGIWVGTALAAIWPWVIDVAPLGGWVLGAASTVLLLAGLLSEARRRGSAMRVIPLSAVAAWNALAFMGSSALLLQLLTGLSAQQATLANLLVTSVAGARVQLALGSNITFALTLIWAMIGIAAALLTASMTVATGCVLAIAALAVVIVRVTT